AQERYVEDARDLLGDEGEEVVRPGALGYKGRDASQRGLLGDEAREVLAALGVGDRGAEELGELREAVLGVSRQRLIADRGDTHDAPQTTRDDHRRADGRAKAPVAGEGGERTG